MRIMFTLFDLQTEWDPTQCINQKFNIYLRFYLRKEKKRKSIVFCVLNEYYSSSSVWPIDQFIQFFLWIHRTNWHDLFLFSFRLESIAIQVCVCVSCVSIPDEWLSVLVFIHATDSLECKAPPSAYEYKCITKLVYIWNFNVKTTTTTKNKHTHHKQNEIHDDPFRLKVPLQ